MADSSGSLVASQRVTRVSMLHVDAKEISNSYLSSLFISPSRIFRFFSTDIVIFCSDACKSESSEHKKFPCNRILLIFVVSNLSLKLAILFWFKAQLFSWYLVLIIAKKQKHAIHQEKSICPVIMNILLNILDWLLYDMIQWISPSQSFPCWRNTKAKLAS